MLRLLMAIPICLTAGCSHYDVTRHAADAAFSMVTAIDKDNRSHEPFFRDADVSRCIPAERRERELSRTLDAIEEGRDYVILPTGERYPVNREEFADEYKGQTPTEECINRHSDQPNRRP